MTPPISPSPWLLEVKGHLVIAIGDACFDIAVPGFTQVDAQLLTSRALDRAFDFRGGERLAGTPFDALAQRNRQLGALLIPSPADGQLRDDRARRVLRHVA